MEVGGAKGSDAIVVAAIDFGTTYSGWAFSFKHEFEQDPTKVSSKNWAGSQLVSQKGPTCVLIKPDGRTLHSFAYDAESKYAELSGEEKHTDWYYFRRFKMMLFDKIGMHRDIKISDATDKKLPAKTVFSLSIKYLKDDLLRMSDQQIAGGSLRPEEIHWVLTVPAIWNDAAKQFMREAAEEAGIPGNRLSIALEPEAASLYCRHLPVEKHVGDQACVMSKFKPGARYLVLDAGGGTVDITVHEVTEGGYLKELHKASGGAWGGTKVDDNFKQFLVNIVGARVMEQFPRENMEDFIEMFRDFEIKKRDIGPAKEGKVTFKLPVAFTEMVLEETGLSFGAHLKKSPYANKVLHKGDKIRIDAAVVKGMFRGPVDSLTDHVAGLLRDVTGCAAIVMVGGFSESPLLQDTVRRKFPGMKIIVPQEAGLAVLKGAVIFGHRPKVITERVSKWTYGIACTQTYTVGNHPASRKYVNVDGVEKVDDIFSVHVKVGQHLKLEEQQSCKTYQMASADLDSVTVFFYITKDCDPKFVDDPGCHKVGRLDVKVPGYGAERQVTVSMAFGKTETEGSAMVAATGEVVKTKLDFLDID
ncbi:heat shock 70 kDa protein 12A-like isoform X2 [Mya arenaria]|nr:heat shock 70 kDa protein 12A-like isoform X2 [Mya arenaria]XP_052795058.1 heat shock 70 kDa protein 12A-like isoform X2 [Mya arenaria]